MRNFLIKIVLSNWIAVEFLLELQIPPKTNGWIKDLPWLILSLGGLLMYLCLMLVRLSGDADNNNVIAARFYPKCQSH